MRFLALPDHDSQTVTLRNALRKDIAIWLLVAAAAVGLYASVGLLIMAALPAGADYQHGLAVLYQQVVVVAALVVGACIAARRRPKDVWTWVLAALVISIYVPQSGYSLSMYMFVNSALQPMIGMVGLLSAGRIVEYLHARYVIKFTHITPSAGAITAYAAVAALCYALTAPWVFNVIYPIL